MSVNWKRVAGRLQTWANEPSLFRYGQAESLWWMAERLPKNGIIIADEVGLGKTRLSLLAMYATMLEGGTVAAVVPPGLLFQWQQEADDVLISLNKVLTGQHSGLKTECLPVRSYSDLFNKPKAKPFYPLCSSSLSKWLLISQAFDLYIIKRGAASWRLELPALVNACLREREGEDRKNRWTQYWRRRGYDGELDEQSWDYKYRDAAKYLAAGGRKAYPADLQPLFEDDRLRPSDSADTYSSQSHQAREDCVGLFRSNKPGRKLLMNMVGKLIGTVDLLVMDEAHKSREYTDVSRTRFGRLVDDILVTSPDARRIGMTATPVELDAEQWSTLLRRVHGRIDFPKWQHVEKAITLFSKLHQKVARHPDQLTDIDALASAAKAFSDSLAPVVTRRRRMHQAEWTRLIPTKLANTSGAHPHRQYSRWPIKIEELDDTWRTMVLALEAQGLAAKGIKALGLAQRQTDIRYSQGLQCEFDMPESSESRPNERKTQRTKYWQNLQKTLSGRINGRAGNWLWNHPRILESANRIEELCSLKDGMPREKVLVFGRFTAPLHALREILNARHLLRIIDTGIVSYPPLIRGDDTGQILHTVWRERFAHDAYSGALSGKDISETELLALAKKTHRRYEAERDRLAEVFNAEQETLWKNLPGDNAIAELGKLSKAKLRDLFMMLRSEVFDGILYEGREVKGISLDELTNRLRPIWKEHCKCMLHGLDDVLSEDGQPGEKDDDRLDVRADRLSPDILMDYFGLGTDGESDARSHFCRVLEGAVGPRTRRSIQAGFNRSEKGPFVLVAQSIVGREGLNLHKACRKVFLLHPEWNPGIMEQQIGRVDRIESLWTAKAAEWIKTHGADAPAADFPRIEVESIVFCGTYDEYQFQVLSERRKSLNAQLFGELLDEETLARIPKEYQDKLLRAAPDWRPGPIGTIAADPGIMRNDMTILHQEIKPVLGCLKEKQPGSNE